MQILAVPPREIQQHADPRGARGASPTTHIQAGGLVCLSAPQPLHPLLSGERRGTLGGLPLRALKKGGGGGYTTRRGRKYAIQAPLIQVESLRRGGS